MNSNPPRVGFVSLGCPKALVDSERILTQLRAEGYDISPSYTGADLVVINTCGFIDEAVAESLDAIGEALNGRGFEVSRASGASYFGSSKCIEVLDNGVLCGAADHRREAYACGT